MSKPSSSQHHRRTATILVSLLFLSLAACSRSVKYDLGDAPDPSYPTNHEDRDPPGPAVLALDEAGEFLAAIILGDCVTVETAPKPQDECDDSQPTLNLMVQQLQINVRRTGVAADGPYWINLVVDLDGSGDWDPDSEWVVRNCPVPIEGPQTETILCPITGSSLAAVANGWVRVLIADQQAPAAGWDGSAFFAPGEARGEVEDYNQSDLPPTAVPPTATPTATPTVAVTPTPEGETYSDSADDAQQMDEAGNLTGVGLPGHPADIDRVQMMWVTEGGQRYLEIWVFRNKDSRSFSSAVQAFIASGPDDDRVLVLVVAWEDHADEVRTFLQGPEGEIDDERVVIRAVDDGAEVHFKLPADLLSDGDRVLIYSYDMPVEGQLRGFDGTDIYVPLPQP